VSAFTTVIVELLYPTLYISAPTVDKPLPLSAIGSMNDLRDECEQASPNGKSKIRLFHGDASFQTNLN
jgi:hypothetical protein